MPSTIPPPISLPRGLLPANDRIAREHRHFFMLVYAWMCGGLLVSALTALFVAATPALARTILGNQPVFYGLLAAEFGLVVALAAAMSRLSAPAAKALFLLYCVATGLTTSVIFFAYQASSIASMFFVAAGVFGIMGAYGYYTDHDLTSWGHVLLCGLLGIVLAGFANLWLRSNTADFIVSVCGVLIFTGLIAYDTQKLKRLDPDTLAQGSAIEDKEAILGALELYLDFVNLFLQLLRLFGKKK